MNLYTQTFLLPLVAYAFTDTAKQKVNEFLSPKVEENEVEETTPKVQENSEKVQEKTPKVEETTQKVEEKKEDLEPKNNFYTNKAFVAQAKDKLAAWLSPSYWEKSWFKDYKGEEKVENKNSDDENLNEKNDDENDEKLLINEKEDGGKIDEEKPAEQSLLSKLRSKFVGSTGDKKHDVEDEKSVEEEEKKDDKKPKTKSLEEYKLKDHLDTYIGMDESFDSKKIAFQKAVFEFLPTGFVDSYEDVHVVDVETLEENYVPKSDKKIASDSNTEQTFFQKVAANRNKIVFSNDAKVFSSDAQDGLTQDATREEDKQTTKLQLLKVSFQVILTTTDATSKTKVKEILQQIRNTPSEFLQTFKKFQDKQVFESLLTLIKSQTASHFNDYKSLMPLLMIPVLVLFFVVGVKQIARYRMLHEYQRLNSSDDLKKDVSNSNHIEMVNVPATSRERFMNMKRKHDARWLMLRFDESGGGREVKELQVIRSSSTREWPSSWRELVQALPEDSCCYFLCDFECRLGNARTAIRPMFGLWTPDMATTKQKVFYHQFKNTVKKEFPGTVFDLVGEFREELDDVNDIEQQILAKSGFGASPMRVN